MSNDYRQHQDASRVPADASVRILQFDTLEEKARWLDAASSLDSLRYGVENLARRFLGVRDAEARTRRIHRFVRDTIRYEHDYRVTQGLPGEEFADTETVFERGYDDCDGKARAFVAIVRAAERLDPLGVEARIRPVFQKHPLDFVHVQAEVRFHGSEHFATATPDGWVIVELILKGCEMGQNPDACPRGPHGERLLA